MPYKLIDDYVRGSGVFKFGGGANKIDLYDTDVSRVYKIYSGGGTDFIKVLGSEGNPSEISIGTGNYIDGGSGSDRIVCTNNTSDTLIGGLGSDIIYGGDGNDTIYGANPDNPNDPGAINYLYGDGDGSFNDIVINVGGDDIIYASMGVDIMRGGSGADTFVIPLFTGSGDIVEDFSSIDGDKINLAAYGYGGGVDFETWAASHLSYSDDNAYIDLGGGNKVTLLGVADGSLTYNDFLFV